MQRCLAQFRQDLGSSAGVLLLFYQSSTLNAALGRPLPSQFLSAGPDFMLMSVGLPYSKVEDLAGEAWRLKRTDGSQGPHGPSLAAYTRNDWQTRIAVSRHPLVRLKQEACCQQSTNFMLKSRADVCILHVIWQPSGGKVNGALMLTLQLSPDGRC